MKLESIEYIEENEIIDFSSQNVSGYLDGLKEFIWQDFTSKNRKIGKFLLYLRYPNHKQIVQENANSLDFNIFALADVIKKIEQMGYGYIFSGKWGKQTR